MAGGLLTVPGMRHPWLLALAFASCFEEAPPAGPTTTSFVVRREIPLLSQQQIDLVFVVDNSPAMASHRANLSTNARRFVDALGDLQFGMPDVHIGVITTDVGARGSEDTTATPVGDCTANGDAGVSRAVGAIGNFFTDRRLSDGTRQINYDGNLDDNLAATFDALPTGCSFARPLEAIRHAIDNPANTGMIREHAGLVVVFLSASDDCSFRHSTFLEGADAFSCTESTDLVPVAELAAALKASKDDPAKVIVAGGFGPAEPFVANAQDRTVEPSCVIDQRSAQPGVRLAAFLDQFPNRNSFASLCQDDLVPVLELLQQLIKITLGAPCFEQTIPDVDPVTPGDQFDCAAWLRARDTGEETVLPPCDDTNQTCWQIVENTAACPGASSQILELEHYFPSSDPTTLFIECAVRSLVE